MLLGEFNLYLEEFGKNAVEQVIIITGVRPEDKRALASKSRCLQSCYSFNIFEVQCDSISRDTWRIELAMHRAMLRG